MKTRMVALVVLCVMSVGCAGSKGRVQELERELGACRTEQARLQEHNTRLQGDADEAAKLAAARQRIFDELRASLRALIDAGTLTVTVRNGLIVVQLPNKVLFDSGKDELKADARQTLVEVARALAAVKERRIFVSGHTDNQPIKVSGFRDNWELSSRRAYNVHALLVQNGLSASHTAIASFADTDGVGDNTTDAGRAENRRTEIFLLPNLDAVLPTITAQKGAPKS